MMFRRWVHTPVAPKRRAVLKRQGSIDSSSTISLPTPPPAVALDRVMQKSMITGNVHGGAFAGSAWAKKPLFAREGQGESSFNSGREAVQKLQEEALRRDPFQSDYADSLRDITASLAPMIELHPKLAWVTKQLMEPEAFSTFRVSWQDDLNNWRMNRGYRLVYSSALPPSGAQQILRLDHKLTHGLVRMLGFEQVFQSALNGVGGDQVLGADLNPTSRSPQELARFTKAFCEAAGVPSHGLKLADAELTNTRARFATQLAHELLLVWDNKSNGLLGKRCVVTGSNKQSFAIAKQVCLAGGKLVGFADPTGFVFTETDGEEVADLESVLALEQQLSLRGNAGGFAPCFHLNQRVHSKLEFNPIAAQVWQRTNPDVVFLSEGTVGELVEDDAIQLKAKLVVECSDRACTTGAAMQLLNNNVMLAPSKLVLSGNGVDAKTRVQQVITAAQEFGFATNNLNAGASLAAFQHLAASPMFKVPE
ncbi:hypothetical protein BASA81_006410 [Batrachochytrium salamandrivorans]|nr:hypothetical protein BASA81_006410 [Batrachochytrium salamandrivorans]